MAPENGWLEYYSRFLLGWPIFRCYVSFRECSPQYYTIYTTFLGLFWQTPLEKTFGFPSTHFGSIFLGGCFSFQTHPTQYTVDEMGLPPSSYIYCIAHSCFLVFKDHATHWFRKKSKNSKNNKKHLFLVWWLKHVQVIEYNQSLSPTQVEPPKPPKPPEKNRNIKIPAQNPANPGPKVHHTHNIIHKKICWSHQHGRKKPNKFPMEFPNSMLFKHPLSSPTSSEVPSLVGRPSTCNKTW